MTHDKRRRALTAIAAAHYRACQRRNIKPPKTLTRLYPSLKPKRQVMRRITCDEAREIYLLAWNGLPQSEIGERFGVSSNRVSDIKHGRAWKSVTAMLKRGGGTP